MRRIILIAHNVRSTYNVGSLLRTADGLGLSEVWLSGYTPYPKLDQDSRLPHIANKMHAQIAKTALGAEANLDIKHTEDITSLISDLKARDYRVVAIEQANSSINLNQYKFKGNVAVIVGREVEGIEKEVLKLCDDVVEIPMFGSKESFNVSVAAAIVMYALQLSE